MRSIMQAQAMQPQAMTALPNQLAIKKMTASSQTIRTIANRHVAITTAMLMRVAVKTEEDANRVNLDLPNRVQEKTQLMR